MITELEKVAFLLKKRNDIDFEIGDLIKRPALTGHIGEFIASKIFDIELQKSANNKSFDGVFSSGTLKYKTVNIKFYPKNEHLIDLVYKDSNPPDYYLIMTGPDAKSISTFQAKRPLVIDTIYLFASKALLQNLEESNVKIGIATSIKNIYWKEAMIYPNQNSNALIVSENQKQNLILFSH